MKRVFLVAGEASGDLHGANLASALRRADPAVAILAAGGPLLRRAAPDGFIETAHLTATGFTEVLKLLPRYFELFTALEKKIREARPDAVVLIDNPGFNLRLAKKLRPLGIPIVYYICPQVWGWMEHRVHLMRRCLRKALVVFDFEEPFYARHAVPVRWVGHPLKDIFKNGAAEEAARGPATVLLMPGSRPNEVRMLLPILLDAARRIREGLPETRFLLIKADTLDEGFYARYGAGRPSFAKATEGVLQSPGEAGRSAGVEMVRERRYDAMRGARLAIVCSGTATLECALLGVPMIVVNRGSFLTYLAARALARVRYLGLPNLLAREPIVPELLQYACTAERITREAVDLLGNAERCSVMRARLAEAAARVGGPGASDRAATEILAILRDG